MVVDTMEIADFTKDLVAATKGLAAGSPPEEFSLARRRILATVTRLQSMLIEPSDFIHILSSQSQILACLKWLGDFQVLPCIPLTGSVHARDVSSLLDVPKSQLCRIVRTLATAGFLCEPQPEYIAHTALSAPFVTNFTYLDASMFLAETIAPSALHMTGVTRHHGTAVPDGTSAYNLAFETPQSFRSACVERKRLQRQWGAYRQCVGDVEDGIAQLLGHLNWGGLGNACVVDACARSTEAAISLAEMFPALKLIVQMEDPALDNGTADAVTAENLSRRVIVQKRKPGADQTVRDAAIYVVRPTWPSTSKTATRLSDELRAHLGVLSTNASATMIVAPLLLPEPGTVDRDVEAAARLLDLSSQQLTNENRLELEDLMEIVENVHDQRGGRLQVVSKVRLASNATVAVGVKYQALCHDSILL